MPRRFGRAACRLAWLSAVVVAAGAKPATAPPPAGDPYDLTMTGNLLVNFNPELGRPALKVDYEIRVEYLVRQETAEEAEAAKVEKKAPAKRPKKNAVKVDRTIALTLHTFRLTSRQNGEVVYESKLSRQRYQMRPSAGAAVQSLPFSQAPPALQDLLRKFDATTGVLQVDDRGLAVGRKVLIEGALTPVLETALSVHTPIPKDLAYWESPTRLPMAPGQTARGILRFEKEKAPAAAPAGGPIRVRVSGTLQGEGTIAQNLIKNANYAVTGDQKYDPATRSWTSARWTVQVRNDLATPAGVAVAHAEGTMTLLAEPHKSTPATDPGPEATPAGAGAAAAEPAGPTLKTTR